MHTDISWNWSNSLRSGVLVYC